MKLYLVKVNGQCSYYTKSKDSKFAMKVLREFNPELEVYHFISPKEAMDFITNPNTSVEYWLNSFLEGNIISGYMYEKILEKFNIRLTKKTLESLKGYDFSLRKIYPLENQEKIPKSILRAFYLLKGKIKNDNK